MKAVVQRVERCTLAVAGQVVAVIGRGLVCYLGVGSGDTLEDLDWMAKKVARLRIFPDEQGDPQPSPGDPPRRGDRMNLSAADLGLAILVVPQFTLFGDVRRGYRPSFTDAEEPGKANLMFEAFRKKLAELGIAQVAGGVFGADMTIEQVNRGPVTIELNSREK